MLRDPYPAKIVHFCWYFKVNEVWLTNCVITDWPDLLCGYITDWLTDLHPSCSLWLHYWLNDWIAPVLCNCITDWLTDWVTDLHLFSVIALLTDWLTDWLTYTCTLWLHYWLSDWLTTVLYDCTTDWVTGLHLYSVLSITDWVLYVCM